MLYFAYGLNLNKEHMAGWCPKAKAIGVGVLKDWKLVTKGVLDIEPSPGDSVTGGVWEVTEECLKTLDIVESVAHGMYRREMVTLEDGRECVVYVMNYGFLEMPLEYGYMFAVLQGMADFGIPLSQAIKAMPFLSAQWVK